jgi:hypothetical protein
MKKNIFLVTVLFACMGIGFCMWFFFRGMHLEESIHVQESDQSLYDLLVKVLQNGGAFYVASNDKDYDIKLVGPGDAIQKEDIENIDNLGIRKLILTQKEMALLANIKNLEYLMLVECEFTDDVFAPLENSMIRELYIKCPIEIPGISGRSIQKMKNLWNLSFTHGNFPDDFFKNCRSLNIGDLGIFEVSIRTENLKDMLPLPNLSGVMLFDTNVEDDITGFLDELPTLKTLIITFSEPNKMRCEFIRDMKNADSIEEISIGYTDIDDEILSAITRFKNLKKVEIYGKNLTKGSIPVMESFANGKRRIYIRNDDEILCDFKRY